MNTELEAFVLTPDEISLMRAGLRAFIVAARRHAEVSEVERESALDQAARAEALHTKIIDQ